MASIRERTRTDGGITYTVLWRDKDTGKQESEIFPDNLDKAAERATSFMGLVELAGNRWPAGWVRGKGFVPAEAPVGADRSVVDWCLARHAKREKGLATLTAYNQRRAIELHLTRVMHTQADGKQVPATVANVTEDDVVDWVADQKAGVPDPERKGKWIHRPAAPASVHLRHGLLSGFLQEAVEANPPLRSTNPCAKTKLPRLDEGKTEDDMCFLEHDEYQRIRHHLTQTRAGGPDAADLADLLVGTGLRWGEATAIQKQDIRLTGARPTLKVNRAWRREADGSYSLQAPKTTKSRRTIGLSPSLVTMLRRRLAGLQPEDFVMTTVTGLPWRRRTFRNYWGPAIEAAIEAGLPRRPRIHDLRHTHVAWLIAANVPLPAIQARMGHESIKTTIDRYGHLVRALDAEIAAAIEAAMAPTTSGGLKLVSG